MLVLSCKVSFVWKRSFNISWKDMKYVIQQGLRKKWFFELQARKKTLSKTEGFLFELGARKIISFVEDFETDKSGRERDSEKSVHMSWFFEMPIFEAKKRRTKWVLLCVCENNEKINGSRKRLNYVLHVSSFSGYDKNATFPSKDMYHSYVHRISLCTIWQ